MMEPLAAKGARVEYSDPHVPVLPRTRRCCFDIASVTLDAAIIGAYDLVLPATDHSRFDYPPILKHSRLIVDTRGVFLEPTANVAKA